MLLPQAELVAASFYKRQSSSRCTMLSTFIFVLLSLSINSGLSSANQMSEIDLLDESGNTLCIGKVRCFLSVKNPSVTVTIRFNLTLDTDISGWKFHITVEPMEEGVKNLVDEELNVCPDLLTGDLILSKEACEEETIPAMTDPYTVTTTLGIPYFEDVVFLDVSGPDELLRARNLVSSKSSHAPVRIPDCSAGPC